MGSRARRYLMAAIGIALVGMTACGGGGLSLAATGNGGGQIALPSDNDKNPPAKGTAVSSPQPPGFPPLAAGACAPIRLAAVIDVRQVDDAVVPAIVESLGLCGGQGAIAVVDGEDRSLIRFTVSRPSAQLQPLADQQKTGDRVQQLKAGKQQQKAIVERAKQLTAIEADVLRQMKGILAQRADGDSPLWPAIRRVDLYFREPPPPGDAAPQPWLIYLSDRELKVTKCNDIKTVRSVLPGAEILDPQSGAVFFCTASGEWADGHAPADLADRVIIDPSSCVPDVIPLPSVAVVTVKAAPGPGALDCRTQARFEATGAAFAYLNAGVQKGVGGGR